LALNTFKCNYLTPLHFKGLLIVKANSDCSVDSCSADMWLKVLSVRAIRHCVKLEVRSAAACTQCRPYQPCVNSGASLPSLAQSPSGELCISSGMCHSVNWYIFIYSYSWHLLSVTGGGRPGSRGTHI